MARKITTPPTPAQWALYAANYHLVDVACRRVRSTGWEAELVRDAAADELMLACRRFDAGRGVRFRTHALKWIVQRAWRTLWAAIPRRPLQLIDADTMVPPVEHEWPSELVDAHESAVARLTRKERDVWLSRLSGETFRSIARRWGVTWQRIWQVEQEVRGKLAARLQRFAA